MYCVVVPWITVQVRILLVPGASRMVSVLENTVKEGHTLEKRYIGWSNSIDYDLKCTRPKSVPRSDPNNATDP